MWNQVSLLSSARRYRSSYFGPRTPFSSKVDAGEPGGIYPPEQSDRIVLHQMPEGLVDRPEQATGIQLPAPPEILRQIGQMLDSGRQVGNARGVGHWSGD